MSKKQEKKKNKAESKDVVRVKSTQMFSPIRDIKDGIIITKEGKFVKLMEFTPINFSLRSAQERDAIISTFASAIKMMPSTAQWKIISMPADVNKYVNRIQRDYETEKDRNCRELQRQQIDLIRTMSSAGGVSRRFIVAFTYEQPAGLMKRPDFEDIRSDLEMTASRIASVLEPCGNAVLNEPGDDIHVLEIIYTIFSRTEALTHSFTDRMQDVITRYIFNDSYNPDDDDAYIPINDIICPVEIDAAKSPNYIVVDGTYYSFGYIPSAAYPVRAVGGWLSMLINLGIGIDVDLFMKKENLSFVQNKLNYAIRYNRIRARETEDSAAGYDELIDAIDSGFYLRRGIASGEDFIYMSVLMTVTATSAKEMKDRCNSLKLFMTTQGLNIKFCLFQQEEAFLSSLPICALNPSLQKKSRRNILTSSLASAYPFVSFEVADPNGILYGMNTSNNSLVFIDNFDTHRYKNANMCILGTSGAGKTYTLQTLALRMRQQNTQVFIIAPEKGHEFQRACTAIGGQFIKLSAGSGQNINIMEIRKRDEAASRLIDGEGGSKESILAKKIQQLHTFMTLLIPDMSYEERQQLDEALIKTYHKFGITNRNRSLTDPATGEYKKMPVLGDLQQTLHAMGEPARRLDNILGRYVTGSARSFNAPTNVNLDNKYIVLDLSSLTKELLPIGMFIALDFVYDKAKENRTTRKSIFLDEAWLLRDAQNFVVEVFKLIRGYGGAAIAATQDMKDFFSYDGGKFGKAVINNAKTKVILQLEQDEAEYVGETLSLTEREQQQITRFKRGECLVVSNTNHITVAIKASSFEHDLITTDREDLTRIAEQHAKAMEARKKNAGTK